jgi:hypothetical protein
MNKSYKNTGAKIQGQKLGNKNYKNLGTNITKNLRTKIQEHKLQKFGNINYINLGTKISRIHEQIYRNLGTKIT